MSSVVARYTQHARHAARGVAVLIALAALVDPAVTTRRATKPDLVVVPANPARDSARADVVAHELASSYTVLRAPFGGAAGTLVVGDEAPHFNEGLPTPAFVATDAIDRPAVRIDAFDAPATASLGAQVPIAARARITAARGRTLDVELRAGPLVVERESRAITTEDERIDFPLVYVASSGGAVPLRLVARVRGTTLTTAADALVDVRVRPLRVLFFDPRPSWTSTFVRRAVERDSRFAVSTRIATSRGVSTATGDAPARLDDPTALDQYDAIVVGAPDALTDAGVRGIDAFARRRGGSVILLLDRVPSSTVTEAWTRLLGPVVWRTMTTNVPVAIAAAPDSAALRASELVWPMRVLALAPPIASAPPARGATGDSIPVVWRVPLGPGTLIVSGALDAWRSRDATQSSFDTFWPRTIAAAADAALPPLDVRVANASLRPNAKTIVTVTARDASSLASDRSTVSMPAIAIVESADSSRRDVTPPDTVRLWPGDAPNTLIGVLRAPARPGVFRVRASIGGASGDAAVAVDSTAATAAPDDRDLLAAWTAARGGRLVADVSRQSLEPTLLAAIHAPSRSTIWHPFRSVWWIVPFALALAGEWWLRRRAGLA